MKTLLILILAGGLLAAAFFTRPSEADLQTFVKTQAQAGGSGSLKDVLRGLAGTLTADAYLRTAVYHDRFLWVTIEQNGQTQYVGALGHWFQSGSTATAKPATT